MNPNGKGHSAWMFLLLTSNGIFSFSHAAPSPESCEELRNKYGLNSDVPCSFRFKDGATWNFRSKDARLSAIENENINTVKFNGEKMFNNRTFNVYNAKDINKLVLKPGDQVILRKSGNWKDQHINLNAAGTYIHPIIIRSEYGVKLTGSSKAIFTGAHLIFHELTFLNKDPIQRAEMGWIVLQVGDTGKPCDSCVVNKVTIDNYNLVEPSSGRREVTYLLIIGSNVTVANSSFKNKKNAGKMVSAMAVPEKGFQRLHILKSQFKDRPAPSDNGNESNGYEMLMIGSSEVASRSSFSIIEDNTFEKSEGELEIITVKISDVILRKNIFLNNKGFLNLRATNRVMVENNVFDGSSVNERAGLRVIGAGHWVVGNIFQNFKEQTGSDYYWPLSLQNANHEANTSPMSGYGRTKDIVISSNTFLNNYLGILNGCRSSERLWPLNVHVINNHFLFTGDTYPRGFVETQFAPLVHRNTVDAAEIKFEGNPVYWQSLNLTKPYVALINPNGNTSLKQSGSLSVTAYATDLVGISKVWFARDGVVVATVTAAPYSFNWDVHRIDNGITTWTATAFNTNDKFSSSNPLKVIVDIPVPAVFRDNFDFNPPGSKPAGWSVQSSFNAQAIVVDNVFKGSVGKSVHLHDNSTAEFASMVYPLRSASRKVLFRGAFKFNSTNQTHFVFLGKGEKGLIRFLMASQGRWVMSSDGVNELVLRDVSGRELRYEAGQWIEVELAIDFTRDRYTVKIGPVMASGEIVIPGQDTEISDFRIQPALREKTGEMWVDDIYFEATPSAVSVAKSVLMGPAPSDPSESRAYPVPFRPGHGAYGITVDQLPYGATVNVYTLTGQLVNTLTAGENTQVVWDGKNDRGESVASGVYMVLIEKDGNRKSLKVLVQK